MKKYFLNIWYTLLYQFDQHRNEIPEWWYEKNQPFDTKPLHLKRMTIARDVIAQIYVGRYNVKHGRYVSRQNLDEANLEGSIKERFNEINNCQVCAIGSCFLSIVKFNNRVNFEEIPQGFYVFKDNSKFQNILYEIFSPEQIVLIEIAFEEGGNNNKVSQSLHDYSAVWDYEIKRNIDYTLRREARIFGSRYSNPQSRLIAIMENIIYNKGEFKP